MDEQLDNILTLEDENGEKTEFELLASIDYEGGNYIVLYPLNEEEENLGVVILKEIISTNEEENEYVPLENEEEAQAVFNEFLKIQEDEEKAGMEEEPIK